MNFEDGEELDTVWATGNLNTTELRQEDATDNSQDARGLIAFDTYRLLDSVEGSGEVSNSYDNQSSLRGCSAALVTPDRLEQPRHVVRDDEQCRQAGSNPSGRCCSKTVNCYSSHSFSEKRDQLGKCEIEILPYLSPGHGSSFHDAAYSLATCDHKQGIKSNPAPSL